MSEREERFGHLLQPIRDLAQNWDIDIANCLEDYLSDLENLTVVLEEGGEGGLNFAEAALLIQGSTNVYGRKVEHLYALVLRTIEHLAQQKTAAAVEKKRKAAGDDDDGEGDEKEDARDQDAENGQEFLMLDEVREAKDIDLPSGLPGPERKGGKGSRSAAAAGSGASSNGSGAFLRPPTILLEGDHGSSFKMSTCVVDEVGALIVEGGRLLGGGDASGAAVNSFSGFGPQNSSNNNNNTTAAAAAAANNEPWNGVENLNPNEQASSAANTRASDAAKNGEANAITGLTSGEKEGENVGSVGIEAAAAAQVVAGGGGSECGSEGGGEMPAFDDAFDGDNGQGVPLGAGLENDGTAAAATVPEIPHTEAERDGGGVEVAETVPMEVSFENSVNRPVTRNAARGGVASPVIPAVQIQKFVDPWAPLDPHDPGKAPLRPLRKGKTYRLPPNKENHSEKENKNGKARQKDVSRRGKGPAAVVREDSQESGGGIAALGRIGVVPVPLTGLFFPEFSYLALRERKRRAARARLARGLTRSAGGPGLSVHFDGSPAANARANGNVGGDLEVELQVEAEGIAGFPDDGGDYFGGDFGGPDDDDDHEENNFYVGALEAANGDLLADGAARAGNGEGSAAAAAAAAASASGYYGGHSGPVSLEDAFREAGQTYEDLCRSHVEAFMRGAEQYAHETKLSRRVNAWQNRLLPLLHEQENRGAFDIHRLGESIVDGITRNMPAEARKQVEQLRKDTRTRTKNNKKNHNNSSSSNSGGAEKAKDVSDVLANLEDAAVPFAKVVAGKPKFDVCRTFLASLQLANNGNLKLRHGDRADQQETQPFVLQLVSIKAAYSLDQYVAPSPAFAETSENGAEENNAEGSSKKTNTELSSGEKNAESGKEEGFKQGMEVDATVAQLGIGMERGKI